MNSERVDEAFDRLALPSPGPSWPDATELMARGARRRRRRRRLQAAGATLTLAAVAVGTIPLWAGTQARARSVQIMSPPSTSKPAEGGPCFAQPPGCGTPQGRAGQLARMMWSPAPKPPLSPRYGSTTVWTGTSLLVWGGVDNRKGETPYNDGAAYNPVTRTWAAVPASPLSPRLNTFAVWTGTQALFWGGDNPSALMNGATYDPASRTWAMIPPSPLQPDPQNRQAIAWTGTAMVVIEGRNGAAYNPADRSWTPIPDLPQVTGWELTGTSAAWTGSQVVTWVASESHSANSTTGHATAYTWRPGNPDWTPLPPSAAYTWPGRTDAPIGGQLLFMGPGGGCIPGSSCGPSGNFFPGYWFDPSAATWTELPPTFSGGRGPAVWTGAAMIAFATTAGASPPNLPAGAAPADAVAAFDPSTGAWTDLANSPITDLTYATLTWTGRQLIVLSTGGYPNGSAEMWVLS